MKHIPWRNMQCCVECDEYLTTREVMYSGGRCPYCGYKGEHAGTIVDVTEYAGRWIKTTPWWQFWKVRGRIEYKDEKA
jgi:hypothetical protein